MRYAQAMKSPDLILRCYSKPSQRQWVSVCIDLCLATQADSEQEARTKLFEQIESYVEEALTVDRAAAAMLLSRKAPLSQRLEYHFIFAVQQIRILKRHIGQVFNTVLPVHVGHNCHT